MVGDQLAVGPDMAAGHVGHDGIVHPHTGCSDASVRLVMVNGMLTPGHAR
jgi:hypothetical protein